MLIQLPNLDDICQGIVEFQTLTSLLVHNCAKLSLTSTTTIEDMLQTYDYDNEIGFYLHPHLHDIGHTTTNGHEFFTSRSENKEIQDFQSSEQQLSPISSPNSTERVTEERTASKNAEIVASSIHSESDSSHSSPLSTSQCSPHPRYEISFSQTETYINEENKDHPINLRGDLEANDLNPVEEDDEGEITTPHVSEVTADNLVAKALSDVEESLSTPLKDIASSEANSLRLLTALNFLSHLSLKDVALSDELQAIIDTMHTEFPTILSSFKQAFITIDKFAVIEAHHDKAAITLSSKISNAKSFLDEAQQREEALKEKIILLEKEIKYLQVEKDKCIQETVGYKMELENVKKDKYQHVEDQIKSRQQIFEVDYKWSALLSQFQYNHTVARNFS